MPTIVHFFPFSLVYIFPIFWLCTFHGSKSCRQNFYVPVLIKFILFINTKKKVYTHTKAWFYTYEKKYLIQLVLLQQLQPMFRWKQWMCEKVPQNVLYSILIWGTQRRKIIDRDQRFQGPETNKIKHKLKLQILKSKKTN